VDHRGNKTPLQIEKRSFFAARISPDGKKVALWIIERPVWEIWIYDIELTTLSPLHRDGRSSGVTWMPDGKKVVFSSNMQSEGKVYDIYAKRIDGSREAERMFESENSKYCPAISPDGKLLAFYIMDESGSNDIGIFKIPEGEASIIIDADGDQFAPSFSQDGRWIAYASDETGRFEVYVSAVSGKGGKYPISVDGGTQPVWSRDGKELFYRKGVSMMSVPIETEPSFKHGKPQKLFEIIAGGLTYTAAYDIHPDGNRFLMIDIPKEVIFNKIQVITNWTEELKRLVPTNKLP
jgi:Tol biopolymer transport system component